MALDQTCFTSDVAVVENQSRPVWRERKHSKQCGPLKKKQPQKNTVSLPVAALSVPESHHNLGAFSLFLRLPLFLYALLILPVDVEFRTLKQTSRSISETGRRRRRTRSSTRTFSPTYSIFWVWQQVSDLRGPYLSTEEQFRKWDRCFLANVWLLLLFPRLALCAFPSLSLLRYFKASTWNCCQYVFRAIAELCSEIAKRQSAAATDHRGLHRLLVIKFNPGGLAGWAAAAAFDLFFLCVYLKCMRYLATICSPFQSWLRSSGNQQSIIWSIIHCFQFAKNPGLGNV